MENDSCTVEGCVAIRAPAVQACPKLTYRFEAFREDCQEIERRARV